MDDDRYNSRGNFRFSARAEHEQHVASSASSSIQPRVAHYDRQQYDSYTTHSLAHPESSRHAQQQYHQKPAQVYPQQQQQQREAEWAYNLAPSRSPPSAHDVGARSAYHMSYRAPADVPAPAPAPAAPSLPNRSEWLVLPSVSHALGMYGDTRRQGPHFSLVIRQQPRRGLAIGNSQMSLRTARSVPIDPPPVCELLIDRSGDEQLLSLPEVFIRAQLVRSDSPMDECLPDTRRIEPLVGDTLQSPFNSRIDIREDQSFFVFKELGVRNRGIYRLRFDLFDRVGLRIFKIASIYSDAFEVQGRRKHPGLSASSALMDALVNRGMKYKLRKANDKANTKKRKFPEDFYYRDERSINAAAHRRQSYAAGEYDAAHRHHYGAAASSSRSPYVDAVTQQAQQQQHQLIRPILHRAHSVERAHASHFTPKLARGGVPPRPHLRKQSSSFRPSPLRTHIVQDGPNSTLVGVSNILFISSYSNSTGQASTGSHSTPNSSTTEGTPFFFNKSKTKPALEDRKNSGGRLSGGGELAPSSSGSSPGSLQQQARPTLPPISSLYAASTAGRRASAVAQGYFAGVNAPSPSGSAHRSPRH
ncbi:hypothetical protein NDA13_004762 [Ustilago tritici]|nr:hypothetical protein NDA13_004762 [Ustilago tritici]